VSPRHCSEDDLVLYYYREGRFDDTGATPGIGKSRARRRVQRVNDHLEECEACAALYGDIAATLRMIAVPAAPERGDQYGLEVWQRIRHRLPERRGLWFGDRFRWNRLAVACTVAAAVVAAFVAGRASRPLPPPSAIGTLSMARGLDGASAPAAGNDASHVNEIRRRILLTSVADHFDRSDRVLTSFMNAAGRSDVSAEEGWAEDLLTTSRLYRQDAIDEGEMSVAAVLDDLERSLLEIAHGTSGTAAGAVELEQIRRRIDATALLFKVRLMSDELRRREERAEEAPARRSPPTS
jgi:hypothetical protein